jgi:hypothetical protein
VWARRRWYTCLPVCFIGFKRWNVWISLWNLLAKVWMSDSPFYTRYRLHVTVCRCWRSHCSRPLSDAHTCPRARTRPPLICRSMYEAVIREYSYSIRVQWRWRMIDWATVSFSKRNFMQFSVAKRVKGGSTPNAHLEGAHFEFSPGHRASRQIFVLFFSYSRQIPG